MTSKMLSLFKQILIYVPLMLILMACWVAFLFLGTTRGWWHDNINRKDSPEAFTEAIHEKVNSEFVGNLAMALIEDGRVHSEYFHTEGKSVDRNTVFQTASLSKWISAWGIMKLVEDGQLELDIPVSNYLTRWQLPPSDFDNDGVTVRRLLSHTAGLTDGLGYLGFAPGEPIQTLEESLTQASDIIPNMGVSGITRVGLEPGSRFEYSGGGYTLLQLLVEETTDMTFNEFMKMSVFEPLNMDHSTYEWIDSLDWDFSELFKSDSSVVTHNRYTALAAGSLYSSLADMERFMLAHFEDENQPVGSGILSPATIEMMRESQVEIPGFLGRLGFDLWGMGTVIYASNNHGDIIAGHDGGAAELRNFTVRLDPHTQDGIIILETGHTDMASKLGSEWVFWKTRNVDTMMFMMIYRHMVGLMKLGCIAILLLTTSIFLARNFLLRKSI